MAVSLTQLRDILTAHMAVEPSPFLNEYRALDVVGRNRANDISLPVSSLPALGQTETEGLDEVLPLLEEFVVVLRQKQDAMKHISSLAAPIRRLPGELLIEIFTYVCKENIVSFNEGINIPALRLSVVSTYWRSVAFGTGTFWATISIGEIPDEDLPRAQAALKYLSERSGGAFWNVDLEYGYFHEDRAVPPAILESLRPASRWRQLRFPQLLSTNADFMKGSLTNLICLDLEFNAHPPGDAQIDTFAIAPHLREVKISYSRYFDQVPIILPWTQLTTLHLNNFDRDETIDVLKLACNLLDLRVDLGIDRNDEHGPPVVLAHLEKLSADLRSIDSDMDVQQALSFITSPSLTTLAVELQRPRERCQFLAIDTFIRRSSCAPALTILVLSKLSHRANSENLLKLLESLPSLISLSLHETDRYDTSSSIFTPDFLSNFVVSQRDAQRVILPSLVTLSIIGVGADSMQLNTSIFVDVVQSRTGCQDFQGLLATARLRTIRLRLPQGTFPRDDYIRLRPVQDYQRLDLSISDMNGDLDVQYLS